METLRSVRLGGMGAAEGHRGGKGDIHADLHDAGREFRDGVGEGRVVLLEAMSMGKGTRGQAINLLTGRGAVETREQARR